MVNYYEILEVNEKASKEIISKVFKMHIKKNHPDLFQGEEKIRAEETIKLINEAYETLADDIKRKEYDEKLNAENSNVIDDLKDEIEYLKGELTKRQELINNIGQELGILKVQDYQEDEVNNKENNLINGQAVKYQETIKDSYMNDIKRFFMKLSVVIVALLLFCFGVWKITGVNILKGFIENVFLK